MLLRTEHRFSVSDYYRMAETGVLKSDARVELLDGRIIDMSPIGPFHGGITNRLNRLFSKLAQGRWTVSVQNPVYLDDHSEPESDLMLLKPYPEDYTDRHPRAADVFLLIEVADTTLEYDRDEKVPRYGRAGVPEVWIINLTTKSVEVFTNPHFTGYELARTVRLGERVAPLSFPDALIDVGSLLGQTSNH